MLSSKITITHIFKVSEELPSKVYVIDCPAQSSELSPTKKSVRTKNERPGQKAVRSEGNWGFCQRSMGWDSSGDMLKTTTNYYRQ